MRKCGEWLMCLWVRERQAGLLRSLPALILGYKFSNKATVVIEQPPERDLIDEAFGLQILRMLCFRICTHSNLSLVLHPLLSFLISESFVNVSTSTESNCFPKMKLFQIQAQQEIERQVLKLLS